MAPSVPSLRSSHDGVAHCFASLALHTACACGAVGPFASLVTWRRRSLLRFSCVANDEDLWRRRSLRLARHMTASPIASLLLRCTRRVPVAPSVLSLCLSRDSVAHCLASLSLQQRVHVAPSVPSLRSSHDGVAHCLNSFALQTACAWRRRSFRCACHVAASPIASLLLRCKRRVHVAPSVPSFRSSHDGVAHCLSSLPLQTACACGAVGPVASLVT